MANSDGRVIGLIDMDCFYCQVEQRLQPHLWGKPVVVVQYSNFRGGGVLAVSYEARPFGIKRGGMFAEQAKALCPDVTICYVPVGEHSDKADIQRYRDASAEVFDVLNAFDSRIIVERASVDEAFLDLTQLVDYIVDSETPSLKYLTSLDMFPTTHIADGRDVNASDAPDWHYDREANLREWLNRACSGERNLLRLAVGAEIIERIREQIKEKTQFHCSAGIGSNKMIAKLVCSRHKPRQQSLIADAFIPEIFRNTRIRSIRNLGGKLGRALMDAFSIETMFELSKISVEQLNERFSAQAKWIANIAKGVDDEPVRARDKQTSIAISKNFPGVNALTTTEDVQFWLNGLAKELAKRLVEDQIKNERTACTLHVSCTTESLSNGAHLTKSCQIVSYASDAIYNASWAIMRHFNKSTVPSKWEPSIVNISLSATRFHDGIDQSSKRITEWINRRGEQLAAGKDSEPSSQSLHSAVSKTTTTPNTALVSSVMQDCMTPVAEVRLDSRQIDDNSASAVATSSSGGGAFLPNSLQEIPRDMFAEMPEDIRRELSIYYHQKKVQERGALSPSSKSKTTASPSSTKSSHRRSTNKRITRTSSSTNVEPKNMKKISDFFKKT